MDITLYIPGSDQPVLPAKAAQLRTIRARAKASEAVVNLLCELAYGPRPDAGWSVPPFGHPCARDLAVVGHHDRGHP